MTDEEIKKYLEAAKSYILDNRFKEAEKYLKRVLKEEPDNIEALFHMGLLNELLNRLQEAREYYEKVLELSPQHKGAISHLSKLQIK